MNWKRAAWIAPVAAFAATFGVFAVRHPASVKALIESSRGVQTAVAMALLGLIVLVVFTRVRVLRAATPFALTAVVLGCAVFADVPFDRHSKQNRMLVTEAVVDAPAQSTTTTTAATLPNVTATTSLSPTTRPNPVTTATPTRMAIRHSSGALRGINHSASGTASIIESPDGDYVVRFERFTVQGSPTPVLYVVQGDDVREPGGTKLGAFTATEGTTLDVALPAGVKPGDGWTVLIWCERFATPIANATQAAV